MVKVGFDKEKYLKLQSEHILERIQKFGNKLYLEISFIWNLAENYSMISTPRGCCPGLPLTAKSKCCSSSKRAQKS